MLRIEQEAGVEATFVMGLEQQPGHDPGCEQDGTDRQSRSQDDAPGQRAFTHPRLL
jgi:hypothetical protein